MAWNVPNASDFFLSPEKARQVYRASTLPCQSSLLYETRDEATHKRKLTPWACSNRIIRSIEKVFCSDDCSVLHKFRPKNTDVCARPVLSAHHTLASEQSGVGLLDLPMHSMTSSCPTRASVLIAQLAGVLDNVYVCGSSRCRSFRTQIGKAIPTCIVEEAIEIREAILTFACYYASPRRDMAMVHWHGEAELVQEFLEMDCWGICSCIFEPFEQIIQKCVDAIGARVGFDSGKAKQDNELAPAHIDLQENGVNDVATSAHPSRRTEELIVEGAAQDVSGLDSTLDVNLERHRSQPAVRE